MKGKETKELGEMNEDGRKEKKGKEEEEHSTSIDPGPLCRESASIALYNENTSDMPSRFLPEDCSSIESHCLYVNQRPAE